MAHRLEEGLPGSVDFRPLLRWPGPHLIDDLGSIATSGGRIGRTHPDVVVVLGHVARPRPPCVYYGQFSFRGWRATWSATTPVRLRHRLAAGVAASLEHALAARSTTLLVPAARVAAELVPEGHRRVAVVPNGVDPEEFSPASAEQRARARRRLELPEAAHVVAIVGEYHTARKGLDVLVEAIARGPADEHLVVAGDGPRDRLLAAVTARGLAARVHLTGFVEPSVVYAAADTVAVPSRYEPFSLVALEAAACGLGLVVSARAGAAPHLEGAAEILADPEDAGALRACLDRVRADLDGPRRMPSRAREAAVRLSWSTTAAQAADAVEATARSA